MSAQNNYNLLIQKLDQFTRKYYLNQFLKGLIFSLAIILVAFLLVNVLEHFLLLPPSGRKILFYGFIGLTGISAYFGMLVPLFHYLKLGSIISHEQAANIIGNHFTEVKDRLLNVLQLKQQSASLGDATLINASIDQKIGELNPVPFTAAVDLKKNRRHLKYLLVPLLVLLAIAIGAPSLITDSSTRLIYNNKDFTPPAPFTFNIDNQSLEVVQYKDYELVVSIVGEQIPAEVYIELNDYSYKMSSRGQNKFAYNFEKVQKDTEFKLRGVGYGSDNYTLEVIPKPTIASFDVALGYPKYLGRKDEVLENVGDLTVPEGTRIVWDFSSKATDNIVVEMIDTIFDTKKRSKGHFGFTQHTKESFTYKLKVSSDRLADADSLIYTVSVVPDKHPSIQVQQIKDSIKHDYLFFTGEASDDYGLRSLYLKYKKGSEDGVEDEAYTTVKIPFSKDKVISQFNYFWPVDELKLEPGDHLTYFFEVWDNDGVNGSKSSRSTVQEFKLPTKDQLEEETEQSNEDIKEKLADTRDKAKKLVEEVKDVKESLMEKKGMSWEDKKAVEDVLKKQNQLEMQIEQLQEEFAENAEKKEEFQEFSPELMEKQQKVQELFEELMTDEMKKMFEELEKLLEEYADKEDVLEELEDMEMSNEDLEEELDRMLEQFKQLEFEQKIEEAISELEELGKEQEELGEQTEEKGADLDKIAEEQKEIKEEFEKIKDDIEQMKELSEEADNNFDFEQTDQQSEEVSEQMEESEESLDKGKQQKSSESQKSAGQKMQEMAQQMQQQMNAMQMEQMQLDMAAIRQLLENLVTLSFDQEDLMDRIAGTNQNQPEYVRLIREQRKLKDDSELVEDSLMALSKRVIQLEGFINAEMKRVNKNIESSIVNLEARNKPKAGTNQQFVMTGYNNLALMLSEVMDQMQQQMASQMPGQSSCEKPGSKSGKGEKKGKSMGDMQKELNERLKNLKKEMGRDPGGQGEGSQRQLSKQLAQMAKQQQQIRNALQKMNEMENSDGSNSMGKLEELMKEMEKTEEDLVNKQVSTEMYERQKQILDKLLKAEEALREKETDNERKAETATEISREIPPSLEEYLKKRESEVELYKTVPPALRPYYKQLVETYFKNISF